MLYLNHPEFVGETFPSSIDTGNLAEGRRGVHQQIEPS